MIPSGTRFIGIADSVDLTEKKSAGLNAETQPYTIEDIKGYKVFTALLTQSGGDDLQFKYIGTEYGNLLTIGITYKIVDNDTTDFTNVGAPNNNVGTSFIATGTIPLNQNANGQTYVSYNAGAPVVTVLENTIGNIWFTYNNVGSYRVNSSNLFTTFKTILQSNKNKDQSGIDLDWLATDIINIFAYDGGSLSDGILNNNAFLSFIEIRVYN